MNILVIGNGFDLAHGLPTKYRDFIYFTDRVIAYYEDKYKEEFTFTEMFCKYEKGVRNFCDNTSKKGSVEELISLTEDNCWYNYFREELRENEPCEENESYEKNEGWVDFEESISHVIQVMDRMRKRVKSQKNLWQTDIKLLGEIITKYENYKVSAKYSCGFPDPQVLPIIVVERYLDYFTTIMEDRLWQVLAKPGFRWRNRSGLSMNAARAA